MDLKKPMCSVLLLFLCNETKLKTGSLFDADEGDLREKNQVLRKVTMLCHDH